MIDLALDPSDTRPARPAVEPGTHGRRLRAVLLAAAAAAGLAGFGVAASTVMAGLAAPPRPPAARIVTTARAADWPELTDGLPALAGAPAATARRSATDIKPPAPDVPLLRMAALPDTVIPPLVSPPRPAAAPAQAAAPVAEPPQKRIPAAVTVALVGPAREVAALGPGRTAALQLPRSSETVKAREVVEPPGAAPAASAPLQAQDKPVRKAASARKAPASSAPASAAPAPQAPAAVASADPEPEETEVLGVKLPSLAPAGRKLKEGVDALGDAVRNAF